MKTNAYAVQSATTKLVRFSIQRRAPDSGLLIGGIKEAQEMLDFCGEHNITSDIELIPIQEINEACERFVIDMDSLPSAP